MIIIRDRLRPVPTVTVGIDIILLVVNSLLRIYHHFTNMPKMPFNLGR